MSLSRELIVAAKARADAATEGPWDAEVGEDIEVNALSARTQWKGNVGTPARSWRTTDRILSVDDAEFIAAARADVPVMADALLRVLDLHHEGVAYADDMDEADDVPEDYEHHFCHEDGETWPCATVRAVTGDGSSSNTERSEQ